MKELLQLIVLILGEAQMAFVVMMTYYSGFTFNQIQVLLDGRICIKKIYLDIKSPRKRAFFVFYFREWVVGYNKVI